MDRRCGHRDIRSRVRNGERWTVGERQRPLHSGQHDGSVCSAVRDSLPASERVRVGRRGHAVLSRTSLAVGGVRSERDDRQLSVDVHAPISDRRGTSNACVVLRRTPMTKRLAFMLAVALGACAGSGSGRVEYAAAVTVRSPELVTIEPDVYVLADADEPVFYTDNYYWLYRSGRWYRSHSYDRDWIYVSSPSPRLRTIYQPTAYIRYRSRTHEARNVPTRPYDPYHDDRPRQDVPNTLPPHQQPPLQPTTPPPAYPRPPQQEPPVPTHDHHIDAREPRTPTSPAPRTDRPAIPPGQVDRPTTPPGQVDRPAHDNRP